MQTEERMQREEQEGKQAKAYDDDIKLLKTLINNGNPEIEVFHQSYGRGVFTGFEDSHAYILIKFPHAPECSAFNFPDAFGSFLSMSKPEWLLKTGDLS